MTPDLPIPSDEHEAADYICRWSTCGLSFDCLEELVCHLTAAHVTSQQGSYFCMWQGCTRDKGFNARYKMLIHIRTHTNERPFVCSQCNKRFSRQENLRIHARTHTGEKPYVCGVEGCNKAYSNSSDRFKHSRTHQVEKPYECRYPGCIKRYTDPSSLRKHVKIYGHSKKLEDTALLTNDPPPSISPSSSGSSSLGASPIPMPPTPPSLLPATYFTTHPALSSVGSIPLPPQVTAAAAWTVALQQYQTVSDSFRQFHTVSDTYRQYHAAEMLLRSGNGMADYGGAAAMLPCSPTKNNIYEEEDDDDVDLGIVLPSRMDSATALDLSICQSPLDLSLPSARRRHQ
uniref:Zinc finger protein GLIS2-like n=2 Tax=Hirondellea gigas TaxID=1518452 RepID=A0A6A7FU71_9CRUS